MSDQFNPPIGVILVVVFPVNLSGSQSLLSSLSRLGYGKNGAVTRSQKQTGTRRRERKLS